MARLPELRIFAQEFGLKLITIEDLIAYRMETESLIDLKENLPFHFVRFLSAQSL